MSHQSFPPAEGRELKAHHSAQSRIVYIAVIGVGGVGRCFLSQLQELSSRLLSQHPVTRLSPILIARSSSIRYSEDFRPLSLHGWEADLAASQQDVLPLVAIIEYLTNAPGKVILVDNTSSQSVADAYPDILQRGINIITPNKKAFSGSYELWEDIFNTAGSLNRGSVFHESSVGAGLPIISTLKDLVGTGDSVVKIEGIFSGTLAFLFNSFAPVAGGGGNFSDEVKKAKELGYTEPDPRDDLNGLDVARKLTILARLAGLRVESPSSFPVQSLIPKALEHASSGEHFLAHLHQYDDELDAVKRDAEARGQVIRYVGSIDVARGQLKVGIEDFDKSHPIAALTGSDNLVRFYTTRYGDNPLVVQGAGAGGQVTAMGVTSDLLKVLEKLHY